MPEVVLLWPVWWDVMWSTAILTVRTDNHWGTRCHLTNSRLSWKRNRHICLIGRRWFLRSPAGALPRDTFMCYHQSLQKVFINEMFRAPLGVSAALLTAEISGSAFKLGIKMCCFWWDYENETVLFQAIRQVFIAVHCQVGLLGRLSTEISTHVLREQRENHCKHSAECQIISSYNYSTILGPSAQLTLISFSFLSSVMKKKNPNASISYDLKRGYSCSHVCLHSFPVNHAALWMFPVAKRRHLLHNCANWPVWPLRSRWSITSTASAHLLRSSVKNPVKAMSKFRNAHPFHDWIRRDVAFNHGLIREQAFSVFICVTSVVLQYKLQWRSRNRTKPQPWCVSGFFAFFLELSNCSLTGHSEEQRRTDSGINLKAGKQSESVNSDALVGVHVPVRSCEQEEVAAFVGWYPSSPSTVARENALLTQRVASLLRTVYF